MVLFGNKDKTNSPKLDSGCLIRVGKGYDGNPIKWIVLSVELGHAIILAQSCLASADNPFEMLGRQYQCDAQWIQYEDHRNKWHKSELYSWLNGNKAGCFYHDAFSSDEKKSIVRSEYSTIDTAGFSRRRNDKSFVYIPEHTDFEKSGKVYPYMASLMGGAGSWHGMWLRTPATKHSAFILTGKRTDTDQISTKNAVRPMMKINLSTAAYSISD